jgi:hypothetical protein
VGRRIRALILLAALLAAGVFVGSALSQWWEVPGSEAAAASARSVLALRERVRVEVLNAGGRPNLAREATDLLRDGGFDVVYFGNAGQFDEQPSVVLDRVGRPDLAREVADALGVRSVRSEPDSNLFVDVSVRLGEEWTRPAPPPAAEPVPAWWDPRRLLPKREPAARAAEGALVDPAAGSVGEGTNREPRAADR